ncbi:putative enoyl-CoA hydratase [Gordonia araii NBRC 100433]|uniref:Putative enoyl-CoA hydratase n=1 Tax=Gordonia araii NBRC 100433 TaxID=1073574 RepID=G7H4F6_9ACTN|nr:enoyl-CoA hydratase-related protein [Gordonia araii]NNG96212.1 enoyl-CoA hydratase/isomerase family protein [Gordonia araii NBRC 100433]GAB10731.1 putative enoyl-CoA hydratase [Gordonia araii NBRC 100433]
MTDSPNVTSADGVLTIAVSTSANGTSLNDDAVDEAVEVLTDLHAGKRDERVILLVGAGKNFCAGGNVASFAAAEDRTAFLAQLADQLHRMIHLIDTAHRPVVVAAKGWAAGAGMSLTLIGDVVVGGPSTKMRPAYSGIGLSPDGGMTWSLPRAVGSSRARAIILTNRVIAADEALGLGLLSEIVDDDQVDARAREIAGELAAGPRAALRATAQLLRASPTASLADQMAAESASIAHLGGQPEGIEGVDAFVEKRAPRWG